MDGEVVAQVALRAVLFVFGLLGLHFGLAVGWGWSIAGGIVLAVLGYLLIVIDFDGFGDWDIW